MVTRKFWSDVVHHTPLVSLTILLVVLWLLSALGIYLGEQGVEGASIDSYGKALYWSIAAFSTAGIADMPKSTLALAVGGAWIIIGSLLYFGTIVATVTAYFMRPMQTPSRAIIETIEMNLDRLEDLSVDDLEMLKNQTDALIQFVEAEKSSASRQSVY